MTKQKIVPCLWFDNGCEEAMKFYVSSFSGLSGKKEDSKIISIYRYEKGMQTPGIEQMIGKVLTGIFEIAGFRFMALDGGPIFKLNPSISFFVNFDPSIVKDAREKIDEVFEKLSKGGKVLMELGEYPFSKRYAWVEDKYGVSWQLILTNPEGDERPIVIPSLLFVRDVYGKAEEAMKYYLSVFSGKGGDSKMGSRVPYGPGQEPDKEGATMFGDFKLLGQWFAAMDSALEHKFAFNEAISFSVNCKDQAEVDRLWKKLSSVPESEVCGWLKDKYGVSWQIIPERMGEMLSDKDKKKAHRVLNEMLKMKKIDLATLEKAHKG